MSMPKRMTVFAALLSTSSATTCQELCENLESCAKDPRAHGSYCKTSNTPQTCFGLFYTDEKLSEMCFQPNDSSCPELRPVTCPELDDQTAVELTSPVDQAYASDSKKKPTTCRDICDEVEECRDDPHAHGSYCKFEDTNPICFGLYNTGASKKKICFQPNDSDCPESDPVSCPSEEIDSLKSTAAAASDETADSTDAPNTCQEVCETLQSCRDDPQAHGSYCKFQDRNPVCFGLYHTDESKKDMCFQPNDAGCPEEIPVSCPDAEVRTIIVASADVQQLTCQELCDALPECRDDPKSHGSYCKSWETDSPACFGMYYTSAAKDALCFQPNNKACPKEHPVSCVV